jgi:hypothetical protein
VIGGETRIERQGSLFVPVSKEGAGIQAYVRQPLEARKPVGYERKFLDAYRPNETAYLSAKERAHLRKIGTPQMAEQAAGVLLHISRGVGGRTCLACLLDCRWPHNPGAQRTPGLITAPSTAEVGARAARSARVLPMARRSASHPFQHHSRAGVGRNNES